MPHPVDIHVGKRIRHRRWVTSITQQELGKRTGVKFQQIQKYETGMNRVSASRLWDIAEVLKVPVSFFFEGLSSDEKKTSELSSNILEDKEALQLIRHYYGIPEAKRQKLLALAKVLSDG